MRYHLVLFAGLLLLMLASCAADEAPRYVMSQEGSLTCRLDTGNGEILCAVISLQSTETPTPRLVIRAGGYESQLPLNAVKDFVEEEERNYRE